ncbi:MAG: hypothetical protein V4591_02625 [Bdellovibrionota bacterium]
MRPCAFRKKLVAAKIKLVAALCLAAFCGQAFSSTSLMVNGHAGLLGQYATNIPPTNSTYFALRVPIGLTLQASPSDNLNIYLGLDYAYNNYPNTPTLLGQNSTTATTNPDGQSTPMPFANTINAQNGSGGTPYGEQVDTPTLTTAYFTYQTPMGLLKAGRMPRNWGLGVWHNDEWSPTGGAISTSDAIAFTTDLNLFDVNVYYERYGEAVGGNSTNQSAVAYTAEARLKTDAADAPSTGVSREIGVAFSKFDHGQSNTSLTILDGYGKFYLSKFFVGAEVLYPTGTTQNPNYQSLGGAADCLTTSGVESQSQSKTCSAQSFTAMAALLKMKYQLDNEENTSIFATETAQNLVGTAERQSSNTLGFWAGYASGGANQFYTANDTSLGGGGNNITAIMMNPNIQPSFLMFNNTTPPINGMPTGAITNTTFARLDYTYESPGFGSIGPVLVWGRLNHTNSQYNAENSLCTSQAIVSSTSAINRMCVGGSSNLGVEFDISYRYTTLDRVNVGADLGYWVVGDAWKVYGQGTPNSTYGTRIFTGVQF